MLQKHNPPNKTLNTFAFAATPDGQRFLFAQPVEGANTAAFPLTVVVDWPRALK
jgi:hypothetical protein